MFLELLEKFEKEVLGGEIVAKRHDARLDFAIWLDKQAAQPGVQRPGCTRHGEDAYIGAFGLELCSYCNKPASG